MDDANGISDGKNEFGKVVAEHVEKATGNRKIFKVVHNLWKGTVEFIIDDGRNDDPKMMEAEKNETLAGVESAKVQIGDLKLHVKKMEAKEKELRAEKEAKKRMNKPMHL